MQGADRGQSTEIDATDCGGDEPSDSARGEGVDRDVRPFVDPHDVLGRVPTGETLHRELAAAARSKGYESSVATEIRAVSESLATIDVPDVDLEAARARVAAATGEEDRLKERVATARGEVRARRTVEADTDDALAALEDAAAALSDAQTERVAAEQALERQRELARTARDARERRLRLQDRRANLLRRARRELSRKVYPAFRDALAVTSGGDRPDTGSRPTEYDGPALPASLAAVRIAELSEPVVLSERAVETLSRASNAAPELLLDAPISRPTR
ncbi:hypothetical protein JCM18237_19950 [Halorubrum luteum]